MTGELSDNKLVVSLGGAPEADPGLVGSKAAALGQLVRAGFAVPEGVVLTTRATALATAGSGGGASPGDATPLPGPVESALAAVAGQFGQADLAVRSSGVEEDRPGASYAGQYETVLHVRGLDQLRVAVRRCWASARSDRVSAYTGGRPVAPMAVLVQRQVHPDVAGVAFTANPRTGATDEVIVSALSGPGAELVGGTVTPDEWVVKGSTATVVRAVHQALAEAQVRAVAEVARRIEQVMGGPQDIEWAMAGGRLLILQARPITALPAPPEADLPEGTWFKDVEHYAEPFTAFGASVAEKAVAEGLSSMFGEFGATLERMDVRIIGGEAYTRPVPLGGHSSPPPPWWALALLARLAPPFRRRTRAARRMVRPEVFEALKADWEQTQRPELAGEAARMRAVELSALGNEALVDHLDRAVELLRRGLRIHFRLIPLYTVSLHELVGACGELLGWSEPEALQLVAGTSTASSAPNRALADLAGRIAGNPAARKALRDRRGHMAERLAGVDPDLAAGFADWCDLYAYRCVHDDPGSPVWMERPWLLERLLEDLVEQHAQGREPIEATVSSTRQNAIERAGAALTGKTRRERNRFDRLLSAAACYYPLREDTATWGASVPAGVVRLALLETGRRLCSNGSLDQPDDAANLDHETIRGALLSDSGRSLRARVSRARAERAWVDHHPGPPFHGPAPADAMPDLRGLPKPARRLNQALIWAQPGRRQHAGQPADQRANRHALTGAAASPGRYTGPARIVRHEGDFAQVQTGDVLVCQTTDPAWSILFGLVGALVTDHGGMLAHAAIVAREHGIPAVVGTGNATQVLSSGDIITVSGTDGFVTRPSK